MKEKVAFKNIIFKAILIIIVLVIVYVINLVFCPLAFIPHKHITIILPFSSEYDNLTSIIPMGEKKWHNASNGNPNGHPGIDFNWGTEVPIITSSSGYIISTKKNGEGYDIILRSGAYQTEYKELSSIRKGIHVFSVVNKGDVLGYANHIHWELLPSSKLKLDRLNPMPYFNKDSYDRINIIWKNQSIDAISRIKSLYPDLINGVWEKMID